VVSATFVAAPFAVWAGGNWRPPVSGRNPRPATSGRNRSGAGDLRRLTRTGPGAPPVRSSSRTGYTTARRPPLKGRRAWLLTRPADAGGQMQLQGCDRKPAGVSALGAAWLLIRVLLTG